MATLQTLALWFYWAAAIAQLTLLFLQLGAFRRHRHPSFLVLGVATSLGLVYTAILLFVQMKSTLTGAAVGFYSIALGIGMVQLPIGVWGAAWLFRAYGDLSKRATLVTV
jgi:hypothetical protein